MIIKIKSNMYILLLDNIIFTKFEKNIEFGGATHHK